MPESAGAAKRIYDKPALTHDQLLGRWKSRGLLIPDEARALHYLRTIGYYRLSGYVRSFETEQRDVITSGTTFNEVLDLYIFDRRLRLLVLDPLERIEVAVRAGINDQMGSIAGAHWYLDTTTFRDAKAHDRFLKDMDRLVDEQKKRPRERLSAAGRFPSALEHYVTTYGEPHLPPTWLALEELTFGNVVHLYRALANQQVRAQVASPLGVNPRVLDSWLRTYQRVRNISAHHGRLWNRGLGMYPMIPTSKRIRWIADRELFQRDLWRRKRLYPVLISLQTMLYSVSPGSQWSQRLKGLMDTAPAWVAEGMGIPEGWHEDPFWHLYPSRTATTNADK